MNMDDLANALNKSNAAPKAKGGGQSTGSQPDLGDLMGMLGGGGQQSGGQPDLGSLLGMLGGGGSQSGQGGDPLSGLLGGLLGGGSGGGMSGGPFDALARPLAEKLGISPQIASAVVMFLANALLAGKAGNRSGGGADLNQVLGMIDSGEMDSKALRNNQLVQDLSQQTGLDQQTAARSISAVVDMLGGQQGMEALLGQ
ncbi:MAG TPA: hypothetical protein PKM78_18455 [Anaerolineae bacterium]|nr:hypothetical protein [Anaerolineae bacterium]HNU06095.1 hypothetical protein [Anaerolineae bacterium]